MATAAITNQKAATAAILHYPRLDTVLMVEDAIRKAKREKTKTELWKSLPRQVQYQTLLVILRYLTASNKIAYSKEGKIVWIATNQKLDALVLAGKEY